MVKNNDNMIDLHLEKTMSQMGGMIMLSLLKEYHCSISIYPHENAEVADEAFCYTIYQFDESSESWCILYEDTEQRYYLDAMEKAINKAHELLNIKTI